MLFGEDESVRYAAAEMCVDEEGVVGGVDRFELTLVWEWAGDAGMVEEVALEHSSGWW